MRLAVHGLPSTQQVLLPCWHTLLQVLMRMAQEVDGLKQAVGGGAGPRPTTAVVPASPLGRTDTLHARQQAQPAAVSRANTHRHSMFDD